MSKSGEIKGAVSFFQVIDMLLPRNSTTSQFSSNKQGAELISSSDEACEPASLSPFQFESNENSETPLSLKEQSQQFHVRQLV